MTLLYLLLTFGYDWDPFPMDLIILETSSFLWDNVEKDSFIFSGTHPADHQ